MKPLSLHFRLVLAASLVLTAFLGFTGLALDKAFRDSAETAMRDRLQGHIYALLAAANDNEQGRMRLPLALPDPRLSNPDSGLYAQVSGEEGAYQWQSPSMLGTPSSLIQETDPGEWRYQTATTDNGLYTASFKVTWEDNSGKELTYTLAAGESIKLLMVQVEGFRTTLWSWLGAVALLLLLAQGAVLRWGLAPLRKVAGELQHIQSGGADSLSEQYPRELQLLTGNINNLITHSKASQTRYRNSLGDLAHSLKTPLAVLQGAADTHDPVQLKTAVIEQVPRMNEIVQYQLQRAAASGHSILIQAILIAPLVNKITKALDKVYCDKGIQQIIIVDEELVFFGHEGDLMEVLGNLLDNAHKWCHSKVRFSAENEVTQPGEASRLILEIEDDGSGIPQADIKKLLRRGQRGDEQKPGQGIGLSVTHEIIHLYQGVLEIGESELGGAKITIVFPLGGPL